MNRRPPEWPIPSGGRCCLRAHQLTVWCGGRAVLRDLDLAIAERGLTLLTGPAGSGKSLLLRGLSAVTAGGCWTTGTLEYLGLPLRPRHVLDRAPMLVRWDGEVLGTSLIDNVLGGLEQRHEADAGLRLRWARDILLGLGLEHYPHSLYEPLAQWPRVVQRLVAIARAAATGAALLCIDEPTAGLGADDSATVLDYIRSLAQSRAVLLALRNPAQLQAAEGQLILLAYGGIREQQPALAFFARPQSWAGLQFRDSWSYRALKPLFESPTHDDPGFESPIDSAGPPGFRWVLPGKLAGMPQPGLHGDPDHDLAALQRLGVDRLLSLGEARPDEQRLHAYGLCAEWFPVAELQAPSLLGATLVCRSIERLLGEGRALAIHCPSGLGRTGTLLAAYLIFKGWPLAEALRQVCGCEPRWVESAAQHRFLEEFAQAVAEDDVKHDLLRRCPPAGHNGCEDDVKTM